MKLFLLQVLAWLGRLGVRRSLKTAPQRVLVIKPDHLGDLLLATPALHALRTALPAARISGLVGPWAAVIWAGNRDLDQLLTLPFPGFERKKAPRDPAGDRSPASYLRHTLGALSSIGRPYLLLFKYAALLRCGAYDAALLLRDDHWWGAALALLAGIPLRVGHDFPLSRPFLTGVLPLDRTRHVSRQALDLAAIFAPPSEDGDSGAQQAMLRHPLRFAPAAADHAWAAAWLAANLPASHRLVIIHPGSGGAAKLWPADRWAAVADALAAQPQTSLLLSAGPGEELLADGVAALMHHRPLRLSGPLPIGRFAALLGRAALVLGVDSGPLHLAVSQGVPTVTLFGPTAVERYGPWGDPARQRVVRASLFCSPCHAVAVCPRGLTMPECMELITIETVIAAAGTGESHRGS